LLIIIFSFSMMVFISEKKETIFIISLLFGRNDWEIKEISFVIYFPLCDPPSVYTDFNYMIKAEFYNNIFVIRTF